MDIKDFFNSLDDPSGPAAKIYDYLYRRISDGSGLHKQRDNILTIALVSCHYTSSLAASHGIAVKIIYPETLIFNREFLGACATSSILIWDDGLETRRVNFTKSIFEETDLIIFNKHNITTDGILLVSSEYNLDAFLQSPFSIAAIEIIDSNITIKVKDNKKPLPCGWRVIEKIKNENNMRIYLREDNINLCAPNLSKYEDPPSDIKPRANNKGKTISQVDLSNWDGTRVYTTAKAYGDVVGSSIDFSYFVDSIKGQQHVSSLKYRPSVLAVTETAFVSGTSIIWKNSVFPIELLSPHDPQPRERRFEVTDAPSNKLNSVFILPTSNTHHSHWLLESIQHLHWLDKIDNSDMYIVVSTLTTATQREYLDIFLEGKFRIYYKHPYETISADRVYSIPNAGLQWTKVGIDYLREKAIIMTRGTKTNDQGLIYVSRADSKVYRNLINEPEIESIFKTRGFTVYRASELSLIEKMSVFSNAKIVAGPTGAGLLYTCFAPDNVTCGFISPPHYRTMEFLSLIAFKPMATPVIINAQSLYQVDNWKGAHSSFYLEPRIVESFLDDLGLFY
jgi:hypothetical protein